MERETPVSHGRFERFERPFTHGCAICAHATNDVQLVERTLPRTPKAQHIATLRAEAKRLSDELAQVYRELTALGVYDG